MVVLELSKGRDDRQAGGADGRQHAPHQAHHQRIDERHAEQLRRDRERERDLAERLEVHRRGLVAVERRPRGDAADEASHEAQQRGLGEDREHDGKAAEPERAQRRDLARAARHGGIHRVHRAEDRADPHQARDQEADRPDDLVQDFRLRGEVLGLADGRDRYLGIRRQRVLERLEPVFALEPDVDRLVAVAALIRGLQHLGVAPDFGLRRVAVRIEDADHLPGVLSPVRRRADRQPGELPRRRATHDDLVGPGREHPPLDDLHFGTHAQRLRRDAPKRHVRVAGILLRRVAHDDEELRRGHRAALVALDARRVHDDPRGVAAQAARHLGVAARAHDDDRPGIPDRGHGRLEAFGDRQHTQEHDDDAGDADDGDRRRAEPLADRPDVHAGDGDDLGQHQFLLSASTIRRRPACQAGTAPAAKPSATTMRTPTTRSRTGR